MWFTAWSRGLHLKTMKAGDISRKLPFFCVDALGSVRYARILHRNSIPNPNDDAHARSLPICTPSPERKKLLLLICESALGVTMIYPA